MSIETALIVEDQGITALNLKCILKMHGYTNSIVVGKGRKAIDFLENETPSLALLDIKLTDEISGIDVAKKLQEKGIPFIFISAFSNPDNLIHAKELNPLGIIKKPFNEEILKNMLNNFIPASNNPNVLLR